MAGQPRRLAQRRRTVREAWLEAVCERRDLTDKHCRDLLTWMATVRRADGRHVMTDQGYFTMKRTVMAERLGLSVSRVRGLLGDAKDAKLLVYESGGYNGTSVLLSANMPPGSPLEGDYGAVTFGQDAEA